MFGPDPIFEAGEEQCNKRMVFFESNIINKSILNKKIKYKKTNYVNTRNPILEIYRSSALCSFIFFKYYYSLIRSMFV